jgi:integrase
LPLYPHRVTTGIEAYAGRAKRRGSVEPRQFLFPFRKWSSLGVQELMISLRYCTTCKTAWKALTAAAGIVGRLRPYDLRHTAITDILQIPDVSEETAKSIAGHISSQILKTYSHVRIEAKRAALDALVKRTCGSVGGGRHRL